MHVLYHDLVGYTEQGVCSLARPRYQYLRLSRAQQFICREDSRQLYSHISIFRRMWKSLENWPGVGRHIVEAEMGLARIQK